MAYDCHSSDEESSRHAAALTTRVHCGDMTNPHLDPETMIYFFVNAYLFNNQISTLTLLQPGGQGNEYASVSLLVNSQGCSFGYLGIMGKSLVDDGIISNIDIPGDASVTSPPSTEKLTNKAKSL
jgi:hypothetical protein